MTTNAIQIRHERAQFDVEPDRWLVATMPLDVQPDDLFERQQRIVRPVKVVAGPALRAELPFEGKADSVFDCVWDALEIGMAVMQTGAEVPVEEPRAEGWNALEECLTVSGVDYQRTDVNFMFRVDMGEFSKDVSVQVAGRHALFRAELVALKEPEPVSPAALSHFVLLLNANLRLVRGAVTDRAIDVEVVIPVVHLRPWMLEKATGALCAALRVARRETAALLDPEVARRYVEFHKLNVIRKGEN